MTSVCIIGAGAIGSVIGGRLARAGQAQVSALARGETLGAGGVEGLRFDLIWVDRLGLPHHLPDAWHPDGS